MNAFVIKREMDKFIENLSLNRVDRFYPTALSKYLSIAPGEAFNYLLERSGDGDSLFLKWEIRCPECSRTIEIIDNDDIGEYECICGEEIEVTSRDLFPAFQINPEFKDYIQSEYKKKEEAKVDKYTSAFHSQGNPENFEFLTRNVTLSREAQDALRHNTPLFVQNIYMSEGGTIDMSRNHTGNIIEGSFNESNLSGNNAIQSESVSQSQNFTDGEIEKAFEELKDCIQKVDDELVKEQAELNAEFLKDSLKDDDKPKIQKFLRLLKGALGAIGPLTTIAQIAGVPIPNLPTN